MFGLQYCCFRFFGILSRGLKATLPKQRAERRTIFEFNKPPPLFSTETPFVIGQLDSYWSPLTSSLHNTIAILFTQGFKRLWFRCSSPTVSQLERERRRIVWKSKLHAIPENATLLCKEKNGGKL